MTALLQRKPASGKRRPRRAAPRGRPVARELGLLSFNIGAAAPQRAEEILRWLRTRIEDVLVLTETSAGPGTQLLSEGLRRDGFEVTCVRQPGERGVLVASRIRATRVPLAVTLPCRAAGVSLALGEHVLTVVGTYVPSRDRSEAKIARKETFVRSLLDALAALPPRSRDRLVVAGDYNVVARGHDPPLPGFFQWEYDMHEELGRLGLRSAHELRGLVSQPHSWIGRTGTGYLYDYVHLGERLHHAVAACRYLHGPRERRLSDHAAVSVRLHLS